jgi:hypothetical protein
MPALLTSTSIRPKVACVAASAACTSVARDTSQCMQAA